jgi:hypothetical protein
MALQIGPERRRNEVPDTGFWSESGHAVRHQEPRFRRRRLAIVRDTYRDALDRM